MKAKDMIRQIIREELQVVLNEQARNWWHKPAEAEVDAHLQPSDVHEVKERKPRPSVGKKKSKRKGDARFTSAGTIPPVLNRKLSTSSVKNREEIGKKMLNMFRRGGEEAKNFREKISNQLDSKGLPTSTKYQLSQIWANASSMAANGATATDFPRKSSKEKSKKTKKQDKDSGETK